MAFSTFRGFSGFTQGFVIGSETVYESDAIEHHAVTALSDSKALVIYADSVYDIYVRVLEISGTTITVGSATLVSAYSDGSGAVWVSVTALNDSNALVAYKIHESSGSRFEKIHHVQISGTSATIGSATTLVSQADFHIDVEALSSTEALVTYTNPSSASKCLIKHVTANNTTQALTFGTEVDVDALVIARWPRIVKLSSTEAVLSYVVQASPSTGRSKHVSISGTTISLGTAHDFDTWANSPSNENAPTSSSFSSTEVLVTSISGNYKLSVSGTSLSTDFSDTSLVANNKGSVALNSDTYLLAYPKNPPPEGRVKAFVVSGSSPIEEAEEVYESGGLTEYNYMAKLSSSKAIIIYRDTGNSDFGTAAIINFS